MRRGDVIGVARQTIADQLGVDLRSPRLGMLIFLEHDYASALAHDEAVAILVPRAASLIGLVIEVRAERPGLGETGNSERADGGFRSAREHDVRVAVLDHPSGVADRMRTRRASGDDRMI